MVQEQDPKVTKHCHHIPEKEQQEEVFDRTYAKAIAAAAGTVRTAVLLHEELQTCRMTITTGSVTTVTMMVATALKKTSWILLGYQIDSRKGPAGLVVLTQSLKQLNCPVPFDCVLQVHFRACDAWGLTELGPKGHQMGQDGIDRAETVKVQSARIVEALVSL
uniref:Uncharacterized protein n=1 Tax=Hyaloperonospora arabidopsidis (strain Emoy2) TaxID=559515 RepID=M4C2L4_HYAAE